MTQETYGDELNTPADKLRDIADNLHQLGEDVRPNQHLVDEQGKVLPSAVPLLRATVSNLLDELGALNDVVNDS